ncbi:MAG: glycosyltransferase family 4 protein [Rhodocyclales bacterium]|nr:glycosyltransferase family 4 protein [Rhodocyclales bacterium]
MINNPAGVRPRLLVLTSTFPRWEGDAEPGFVFDLCRHLAAAQDVTVLAPHAPGARPQETLAGVRVVRFRYGPERWEKLAYGGGIMANLRRNAWLYFMLPPFFLAQLLALLGLMRRVQPVAVHAHWIVPQGIVLAAAGMLSRARARVICTAHGSDVSALRGGFWRRLRRWVARRCERIVAVSEALKAQLVEEGCPAERIEVIPMGTDLHGLFVPDGSPRRRAEILFVGRLVPGKGADILLRALPAILARQPEATLTVVGGGPERDKLADLAQRLRVGERVSFTGPVAHAALAAHYRRAALLVLPSREEGFGLVLVEALGCGCPVVASDLPAIRGLLNEGRAGRLFRPGDAGDLALAVAELLTDGDARNAMAERGRQHALSRYDWHSNAQRYAAMLMPHEAASEGGAGHA